MHLPILHAADLQAHATAHVGRGELAASCQCTCAPVWPLAMVKLAVSACPLHEWIVACKFRRSGEFATVLTIISTCCAVLKCKVDGSLECTEIWLCSLSDGAWRGRVRRNGMGVGEKVIGQVAHVQCAKWGAVWAHACNRQAKNTSDNNNMERDNSMVMHPANQQQIILCLHDRLTIRRTIRLSAVEWGDPIVPIR